MVANSTFSCQRPQAACLLCCSKRPKEVASGVPGRTGGAVGGSGLPVPAEGALGEGGRRELEGGPEGAEKGRRQRERRAVRRGERTETRLPERWGQRDGGWRGGQAAGRQCTLAIHSHCGRHMVLSPPSGPQRQSRLSVGRLLAAPGSPASGRPPSTLGLGQSEQGGGQGAGWAGGRGVGWDVGLLRCGDSSSVPHPGFSLWLWVSGCLECLHWIPESQEWPEPGTARWKNVWKAKSQKKGHVSHKRNAAWVTLVSRDPFPPRASASLRARPGSLLGWPACSGQSPRG